MRIYTVGKLGGGEPAPPLAGFTGFFGCDHSPSAAPPASRGAVGKPAGGSARRDSVFLTKGALEVMMGKCQMVASSSTFSTDWVAPSLERLM